MIVSVDRDGAWIQFPRALATDKIAVWREALDLVSKMGPAKALEALEGADDLRVQLANVKADLAYLVAASKKLMKSACAVLASARPCVIVPADAPAPPPPKVNGAKRRSRARTENGRR